MPKDEYTKADYDKQVARPTSRPRRSSTQVVGYITSTQLQGLPRGRGAGRRRHRPARTIAGEDPKKKAEEEAAEGNWNSATLWAGQWWQYQVKAADIGLRAKTYLEQHGAKKVQVARPLRIWSSGRGRMGIPPRSRSAAHECGAEQGDHDDGFECRWLAAGADGLSLLLSTGARTRAAGRGASTARSSTRRRPVSRATARMRRRRSCPTIRSSRARTRPTCCSR